MQSFGLVERQAVRAFGFSPRGQTGKFSEVHGKRQHTSGGSAEVGNRTFLRCDGRVSIGDLFIRLRKMRLYKSVFSGETHFFQNEEFDAGESEDPDGCTAKERCAADSFTVTIVLRGCLGCHSNNRIF